MVEQREMDYRRLFAGFIHLYQPAHRETSGTGLLRLAPLQTEQKTCNTIRQQAGQSS